jgi:autotransporter-associated beta strand protein
VLLQGNTLTVGGTAATTYSGVMSKDGSLIKVGSGTLTLSGANTYTGGTIVSNGTLSVNGSVTGVVTVASGGTLGGTGTVYGVVTNDGGSLAATILDPAGNASRLTVSGNLVLQSGAKLVLAGSGFLSSSVNTYTIVTITNGTLTGTIDPASVPTGWKLEYSSTGITMLPAGYPGTLFMLQ